MRKLNVLSAVTRSFILLAPLCVSGLSCADSEGNLEVSEDGRALSVEYAAAYCGFEYSCDCVEERPPMSFCETAAQAEIQFEFVLGEAAGLTFNRSCFDTLLAEVEAYACDDDPYQSNDPFSCDDYCSMFHGSKGEGEACLDYYGWSDCEPGLGCLGGTCQVWCITAAEGESCYSETTVSITCAEGLECSFEGICVTGPVIGESCMNASCVEGTCGPNGTCESLPGEGDSCPNLECADGLFCDFNTSVCQTPGGAGAPCEFSDQCASYACTNGACEGDSGSWVCG